MQADLAQLTAGAGAALVLAGLLAVLRVREDLVTAITAGLATALFAVLLVVLEPKTTATAASSSLEAPGLLALLVVLVRLFRGGFRDRAA
jgi:hypothetical protein